MKTVNKRVIEIVEPQNADIERVLVFMRSDTKLRVARQRCAAEQYAQTLVCRRSGLWSRLRPWQRIGLLAVAVFITFFVVFCFFLQ